MSTGREATGEEAISEPADGSVTASRAALACRVLLVAGLGAFVDGEPRAGKIRTHVHPLARACEGVTYVCPGPGMADTEAIDYQPVASWEWLPLRLCLQLVDTIRFARSGRHDVIASFSLVPYGIFALIAKGVSGRPAHLGIIGMDLDVHATARYGFLVRWLFRRFDAITVAGEDYRRRLIDMGVPPHHIHIVSHPVGEAYETVSPSDDPRFDLLWVGRMSPEKDPIRFVSVVDTLHRRGVRCTAAMVGDGPIAGDVRAEISRRGLDEHITCTGWVASPRELYRDARIYVLTSEREMLPLTVVEAMAVGLPPVAPSIGGIPDVIDHEHNGVLLPDRHPATYADEIERMLGDDALRKERSDAATEIGETLSMDAVADSWRDVLVDLATP